MTIRDAGVDVLPQLWSVHRLEKEVLEIKLNQSIGVRPRLREHKLEFIPTTLHERGARFWAYADPIERRRTGLRPVRLYRDGKITRMKRVDQRLIQLKKWLSAGADDESIRIDHVVLKPYGFHMIDELGWAGELPAVDAVGSDEISIAELTDSPFAI